MFCSSVAALSLCSLFPDLLLGDSVAAPNGGRKQESILHSLATGLEEGESLTLENEDVVAMGTVNPSVTQRVPGWWKVDGREINTDRSDPNFSLVEGNLLINNPHVINHGGVYQCIATNTFGTIVSREAKVQFAFLQNFSRKLRNTVSVREGQAVVLLCGPPPHYGGRELFRTIHRSIPAQTHSFTSIVHCLTLLNLGLTFLGRMICDHAAI
ncbi:unnamed protein product [Pleuronectes platessa]|uniref:Ig-like domain-containing protein n=1 Tax=Pleuronectes platessa TaxID=8262 RepID=A0A9N7TI39_PLEPL|nr:unnamed protein product [Pleuronectes platessa]